MKSLDSQPQNTLYLRLGGYDVVASVIDEFLSRFQKDPRLARFGGGRSLDSRRRSRQLLVDQICSLAGGPCVYAGRDMKTSHEGLGVTEAEWQINLQHISAALDKYGIAPKEKEEFVAIFQDYKGDIVEKS